MYYDMAEGNRMVRHATLALDLTPITKAFLPDNPLVHEWIDLLIKTDLL